MSARNIIAKQISGAPFPSKKTFNRVDDALDALATAGYRILAPGDLDRETLEAAAKVASWAHMVPPDGGSPTEDECRVAERAAAAIRALGGGEG